MPRYIDPQSDKDKGWPELFDAFWRKDRARFGVFAYKKKKGSMRMTELSREARKRLAEFLPDALQVVLNSYREFTTTQMELPECDPDAERSVEEVGTGKQRKAKTPTRRPRAKSRAREFKEHHDACKTAVGHLELLLKVASNLKEDMSEDESAEMDACLDKAASELNMWKTEK